MLWYSQCILLACIYCMCILINPRLALDSIVKEIYSSTECKFKLVESRHILRARLESIVWFFLTLVLAIFIPDILKVMGPLGGLASIYMLIFPGIGMIEYIATLALMLFFRIVFIKSSIKQFDTDFLSYISTVVIHCGRSLCCPWLLHFW